MKLYGLFHDQKNGLLKIEPFNSYYDIDGLKYDGIAIWNQNWYVSTSRKVLREKAISIKNKWILEAEERLDNLKELKIMNKY